jgi:hypothetical protein
MVLVLVLVFFINGINCFHNTAIFRTRSQSSAIQMAEMNADGGLSALKDTIQVFEADSSREQEDKTMVNKMQRDLWDELRHGEDVVLQSALKEWDDVRDFMRRGIIDEFTMDAIFKEIGVTDATQGLSFAQTFEAIDLINHVGMALDEDLTRMEEEEAMQNGVINIETENNQLDLSDQFRSILNSMGIQERRVQKE